MHVWIEFWKNVNGWHWMINTDNWRMVSQRTYRTRDAALASARVIAAHRGLVLRILPYEDIETRFWTDPYFEQTKAEIEEWS